MWSHFPLWLVKYINILQILEPVPDNSLDVWHPYVKGATSPNTSNIFQPTVLFSAHAAPIPVMYY